MRPTFLQLLLTTAALAMLATAALRLDHVGGSTPPDSPTDAAVTDVGHELTELTLAFAEPPADGVAPAADRALSPNIQPPPRERRRAPERLSDDHFDRCIEVARDIDPELGLQLARKREKNAAEFEQTIREGQVGRGLLSMVQLKQRDPELYRLKISEMTESVLINRVAAQLQQARQSDDQGQIDALTAQLKSMLQNQMAMDLKRRAEYLCRIEEQVKTLREEIEHDAANFRKIVDARLQQLIEQPPSVDSAIVLPAASHSPR